MKTVIEPLLIFDRIQELYKHLGIAVDIDIAQKFTIYNMGNLYNPKTYESAVYRGNFFSFVFVKDARGKFISDNEQYDIAPRTIFFNTPGHIKKFRIKDTRDLYLLTFTECFLKENVHSQIFEEFPFLLAESILPQVVPAEKFSEFEELYMQIEKAFFSESPYRNKLIAHLFVALLIRIKDNLLTDNIIPSYESCRASEIVNKFKIIIEQHYRDLGNGSNEKAHRVTEYAEILNLHPNYLNNVIKSKTGKSVGNWIAEKTIAEAKALLKNSNIPVKEISYRLGFSEIQHFSTYFKKHTQYTPVLYRQIG
jgi:AraC family transcriptional regulator, transcriptional activator of pobA